MKAGIAEIELFLPFFRELCRKKQFLKYNCNIPITQLTNWHDILQHIDK